MDESSRLESLEGAEINEAKKILADEATKLCHGSEAVEHAKHTAATLFEAPAHMDLSALPRVEISQEELHNGVMLIDLLVRAGLCQTKGEARRLIRGNGAKLNDQPIVEEEACLTPEGLIDNQAKLSSGKKRHVLVVRNIFG